MARARRDARRPAKALKTVILVPRRAGIPERDAIWAWCRRRWEETMPETPIVEGHHDDGPFNRSAAINLASRLADKGGRWDHAVIVDADVFIDPDRVREAIVLAERTGHVVWAFGWWAGTTKAAADRIVAGELDPDDLVAEVSALHAAGEPNELGHTPVPVVTPDWLEKINPVSWSCCFVVPRAAFDRLGGFDERFAGWGWEDMAFQSASCGLIGHERLPGAVLHLWHPRAPGLGQDGVNKRRNRQLGRRYMYALRAKGLHDRADPASDEEMQRDRDNLRALAAKEETTAHGQPAPDLPDWREWWPSLEELVESWKDGRPAGPAPRLSMIVRTGGTAEAWPARREYLERTMASLVEHVRYDSVVRRVVYSDWPEAITPELTAIAERHGFYVVGEGNVGYTPSMQKLWRYLASRRDPFEYVFLAEDDFVYERDVDLAELVEALEENRHLVQVALLRDACYPAERERGGILGHPVEEFTPGVLKGSRWLEHRRFFTTNPTVFRRSLTARPWPTQSHSEAVFGRLLFADSPTARSALWGEGEPWVTHIGEVRAGAGY